MTLIIGLVHDGQAYLASDSIGSNGHTCGIYQAPKLFSNGKLKLGYTSSFRMGQLLEHNLSLSSRAEDQALLSWLIRDVVGDVRGCLSAGGFARNESGAESGGTFLLVAEHRLFSVHSDYSLLERVGGYDACGSGEDYALAVLHATRHLSLSPLARLRLALEAAEAHVVSVRGPWWVMRPEDVSPVLLEAAEAAAAEVPA